MQQARSALATLAVLVLLAPAAVHAQGVILQNDSFTSGQAAVFQSGFVTGEVGAVRLAPAGPFPAEITAVQFLFGGAAGTHTVTLRIWEDGAGTVAPGTEVFSGDFVVTASDSVLHEIDLTEAPVLVAGPFRVGIEFQHDGLPSIARDNDGIVAGRNFVRSGGWVDASALGITGDWIIRARVGPESGPPPGDTLQNDSFTTGQLVAFQAGFVTGEIGAVRLTPTGPFPVHVQKVQFLFGGAPGTQSVTLRIWDDSAGTDAPGTELFAGEYLLTASDSALQEIDLGDASVLVSGPFRVGIEFQHDSLPSIARDTNGIAAGRNFIYAGVWADSMLFGLAGDWIIRARVGPVPPPAPGDVVQNDSFTTGQAAGFQAGFVASEIGASRLTPPGPFPMQVTAVQFLFGGDPGLQTITLRIWDDSAGTTAPGAELFSGDYFVVPSNSVLQEIDLSGESILVSGPFRVGIEFQHDGLPSIARDIDGIVAGRNFIYAAASWFDSTLVGLMGDWIIRARVGPGSPSLMDPIFENGFESGDLSGWSSTQTDGGDLGASAAAAMAGTSAGLQAVVDDTVSLFVADDTPEDENRYRARFYFDPNGFDPGEAQAHLRTRIFIAFQANPTRRLAAIVLRRAAGVYSLMGRARLDDGSQADTGFVTIGDGPHSVEIDWTRSTGPDANDGSFYMWIDGVLVGSRIGLDNSASAVDFARMGALSVKSGASGTLYWDELETRRESKIGP